MVMRLRDGDDGGDDSDGGAPDDSDYGDDGDDDDDDGGDDVEDDGGDACGERAPNLLTSRFGARSAHARMQVRSARKLNKL